MYLLFVLQGNGRLLTGIIDYIAEGLGSAASAAASKSRVIVGLELNRNFLRPAFLGQEVTAIAKPLRIGSMTQVWFYFTIFLYEQLSFNSGATFS
jgi:uncharacterized protein (TIGR00369 family)